MEKKIAAVRSNTMHVLFMNTWQTATFQETVEPGDANKVPNGGDAIGRKICRNGRIRVRVQS